MPWSDLAASFWPAADNYYRRRAEVRAVEDVPYVGDGLPKHRLDLFVPRGEGPFPVVVFFHGGFWKPQDRKLLRWLSGLYSNVGVALALEGLACAVPSVRQGSFADTEADALAAVAWLRAHGREHGLDPDRLALAGHSAGGNLALSLAWDPEGRAGPVCAAVSMCSAYDLPRLLASGPRGLPEADARRYFADDATLARLSPERRARADATPALLVTSSGDDDALRREHASFVKACRDARARHEELALPSLGHMGVALEMGRRRDRVTPAVASFVARRAFEAALPGVPDVLALLDGVLRPERPRLDAARAAVEGAATGAEAWAGVAAAGLLPPSWEGTSASRCFGAFATCSECGGTGAGDHGGPCLGCFRTRIELTTPAAAPPSVAAAVAIASLPAEALTALEALAWRSAEALAPWKALPPWARPAPTRVCWCATPARAWRPRGHQTVEPSRHASLACAEAGRSVEALVRAFERVVEARGESPLPAHEDAVVELENAVTWRAAARAGLRVPALRGAPEGAAPVGEAFASLPDPFEPRVAVWAAGCAVDHVARDGSVVIVVPA